MEKWILPLVGVLISGFAFCSCAKKASAPADHDQNRSELLLGNFNADSAYNYIARQVAFGPRIPGTAAHDSCAQYFIDEFKRIGVDTMYVQHGKVTAFNGDELPITNIIVGFNPHGTRRILLLAHYDTRPWADQEKRSENRMKKFDGANDGGSGVGVLLEIARNLAKKRPAVGVDILLVDAEDYGDSSGFSPDENSWCLGTQYWVEHMHPYKNRNLPVYGILLDMVGGKNARFHYEHFSQQFATMPTNKVWGEARLLGYDNIFIPDLGGAINDDHKYLIRAGIPTTDIIETLNEETKSFPPTWHTFDDNMDNIDKASLQAVGETVLNVVYKEKAF